MTQPAAITLPRPEATALFLDLDATLLEVSGPTSVAVVPPARVHLLARLHDRLEGALALLSARPVAAVDDLIAPLALAVAGRHGLELRHDDGSLTRSDGGAALERARPPLAAFALDHPGVELSEDDAVLALDTSAAPDRRDDAVAAAEAAATAGALAVRVDEARVEVRPAGADEGAAVAALLAGRSFRGRAPCVVGGPVATAAAGAAVAERAGVLLTVDGAAEATGFADAAAARAALEAWLDG